MSAWDYNTPDWGSTDSTDYTTPTVSEPEPVAQDDTAGMQPQVEDVNVETETDETVSKTTADAAEATGVEAGSDDDAKPDAKEEKHARAAKRKRETVANLDEKSVRKVYEMVKLLKENESAVAVAKLMTGTRKSDPFTLVSALTNGRNATRAKRFADIAERLTSAGSTVVLGIRLPLLFDNSKTGVEDVFALLNAVAPDRGFGRVNKPERDKYADYAEAIVEKWGDGVDMSMVSRLRL